MLQCRERTPVGCERHNNRGLGRLVGKISDQRSGVAGWLGVSEPCYDWCDLCGIQPRMRWKERARFRSVLRRTHSCVTLALSSRASMRHFGQACLRMHRFWRRRTFYFCAWQWSLASQDGETGGTAAPAPVAPSPTLVEYMHQPQRWPQHVRQWWSWSHQPLPRSQYQRWWWHRTSSCKTSGREHRASDGRIMRGTGSSWVCRCVCRARIASAKHGHMCRVHRVSACRIDRLSVVQYIEPAPAALKSPVIVVRYIEPAPAVPDLPVLVLSQTDETCCSSGTWWRALWPPSVHKCQTALRSDGRNNLPNDLPPWVQVVSDGTGTRGSELCVSSATSRRVDRCLEQSPQGSSWERRVEGCSLACHGPPRLLRKREPSSTQTCTSSSQCPPTLWHRYWSCTQCRRQRWGAFHAVDAVPATMVWYTVLQRGWLSSLWKQPTTFQRELCAGAVVYWGLEGARLHETHCEFHKRPLERDVCTRSCVRRLTCASWLPGAVVSSGTLSFFRCNTEEHWITFQRKHTQARLAQSAEHKALVLVVVGSCATVGVCIGGPVVEYLVVIDVLGSFAVDAQDGSSVCTWRKVHFTVSQRGVSDTQF